MHIMHNDYLGRQTPKRWMSPCSFLFTASIAKHDIIWYGTIWRVGISCPVCTHSCFLCTPRFITGRANITNRRPWCCGSTAQQQLKHLHTTMTVLVINLKHSSTQVIIKKVNPLPPEMTADVISTVLTEHANSLRNYSVNVLSLIHI